MTTAVIIAFLLGLTCGTATQQKPKRYIILEAKQDFKPEAINGWIIDKKRGEHEQVND